MMPDKYFYAATRKSPVPLGNVLSDFFPMKFLSTFRHAEVDKEKA